MTPGVSINLLQIGMEITVCRNIHGTYVTANNSTTNNNIVFQIWK